jgi:hypothetical protein
MVTASVLMVQAVINITPAIVIHQVAKAQTRILCQEGLQIETKLAPTSDGKMLRVEKLADN